MRNMKARNAWAESNNSVCGEEYSPKSGVSLHISASVGGLWGRADNIASHLEGRTGHGDREPRIRGTSPSI